VNELGHVPRRADKPCEAIGINPFYSQLDTVKNDEDEATPIIIHGFEGLRPF